MYALIDAPHTEQPTADSSASYGSGLPHFWQVWSCGPMGDPHFGHSVLLLMRLTYPDGARDSQSVAGAARRRSVACRVRRRCHTPPEFELSDPHPTQPPEYETLDRKVWVLGGLMVALAIAALVLMLRDFTSESYLYLAFYAVPANSAVSVFPHEPVVIWYGSQGSIWWTAAAATLGTLVAGYLDHSVFTPVMNLKGLTGYKEKGWYQRAARLFGKYPFATLLIAGFSPIPFFPFKFLSFSVRYPLYRYLGALLAGRFPRYVLLALLGSFLQIPGWVVFAFFGAVILIYAVKAVPGVVGYLRESRTARRWNPERPDGRS